MSLLILDRFWNSSRLETTLVTLPPVGEKKQDALCVYYDNTNLLQLIIVLIVLKFLFTAYMQMRQYWTWLVRNGDLHLEKKQNSLLPRSSTPIVAFIKNAIWWIFSYRLWGISSRQTIIYTKRNLRSRISISRYHFAPTTCKVWSSSTRLSKDIFLVNKKRSRHQLGIRNARPFISIQLLQRLEAKISKQ